VHNKVRTLSSSAENYKDDKIKDEVGVTCSMRGRDKHYIDSIEHRGLV
jgi:hypothetical protein